MAGTGFALRRRGPPMSVLSASERSILTRMLGASGIRDYFVHVLGLSNLYAASKLDLGRELMHVTGCTGGALLLIGDTLHDFEVSRELGWRCVLLEGGHQAEHRLRRCGCPVMPDLPALRHYLEAGEPDSAIPDGVRRQAPAQAPLEAAS